MLNTVRPLLLSSLALAASASAQSLHAPARLALLEAPASVSSSVSVADALPDEPLAQDAQTSQNSGKLPKSPETAPGSPFGRAANLSGARTPRSTDITVPPHTAAPRQTAGDKLLGSVYDSVSPFSFVGELVSAGYSQLTDGSPNYDDPNGSTGVQFGKRLGAAVARGTSQNLFSEGVLAAVLHEDPRYYQMGSGNNFIKRLFYAGTRPIVTRTDSGATTPNIALLGGYLGAAELTPTYYPALNSTQTEVMKTWGASIGGAALGYVVTEFLPDVLSGLHLQRFNHH